MLSVYFLIGLNQPSDSDSEDRPQITHHFLQPLFKLNFILKFLVKYTYAQSGRKWFPESHVLNDSIITSYILIK